MHDAPDSMKITPMRAHTSVLLSSSRHSARMTRLNFGALQRTWTGTPVRFMMRPNRRRPLFSRKILTKSSSRHLIFKSRIDDVFQRVRAQRDRSQLGSKRYRISGAMDSQIPLYTGQRISLLVLLFLDWPMHVPRCICRLTVYT